MSPKEIKAVAPDVATVVPVQLPQHSLVAHGAVPCPQCGACDTGFYEVAIYRRDACLDAEGRLGGDRIGSLLDQEDVVRDACGRTLLDCIGCGYRFTVSLDRTATFLGAYI